MTCGVAQFLGPDFKKKKKKKKKDINYFLTVSETGNSKIKKPTGWVSGDTHLPPRWCLFGLELIIYYCCAEKMVHFSVSSLRRRTKGEQLPGLLHRSLVPFMRWSPQF
jgi:hypothetical protein